jgi:hypothetical protein
LIPEVLVPYMRGLTKIESSVDTTQ